MIVVVVVVCCSCGCCYLGSEGVLEEEGRKYVGRHILRLPVVVVVVVVAVVVYLATISLTVVSISPLLRHSSLPLFPSIEPSSPRPLFLIAIRPINTRI